MTIKQKVERIAELQNEINNIFHDLQTNHGFKVLRAVVDYDGLMTLQIGTKDKYKEIYPDHDLVIKENSLNNKLLVEVEGVEVFTLQPKLMKGEVG